MRHKTIVLAILFVSIINFFACEASSGKRDLSANLVEEFALTDAPDTYAGVYTDEQGFVNVGFTQDADRQLANLKTHFKNPEKLRLIPAQYTKSQLDETTQAIGRDISSLRDQGIIIHLVEPNLPLNRVDVRVASADPDTIAFLKNKYGPQVDVASGGIAPVRLERSIIRQPNRH